MKKINIVIMILIGVSLIFSSCSESHPKVVKEPEELGAYVFEILKELGELSDDEYRTKFISVEDIREICKNPEVRMDDETRMKLMFSPQEDIYPDMINHLDDIKSKGYQAYVKWDKLELLEHDWNPDNVWGNMEMIDGGILVKFRGKQFIVQYAAVNDNGVYKLLELKGFKEYEPYVAPEPSEPEIEEEMPIITED
jgi:hypothetical protein